MLLENKVAIITGASQGIGKAISEMFAINGAQLALCDINLTGIKNLLKNKTFKRSDHRCYSLDLIDVSSINSVVHEIHSNFGRIDILVNCAGIFLRNKIIDISLSEWNTMFDINLKGQYFLAQAVAKVMISEDTQGRIINISSISGVIAQSNKLHYSVSKAALIHLTKCLAYNLAPYNINVNAICPGPTITPQIAPADPNEYLSRHMIPKAKLAMPSDQAKTALFLACGLSEHLTGQAICVDGGESMTRIRPLHKTITEFS